MPGNAPAHDFLLPRLTALVNEAVAAGIARDVAVAVLIDLVTAPQFDTAAPDPHADSGPPPIHQRSLNSPMPAYASLPVSAPPIDAQDEADFVKPIGPLTPS